MILKTRLDIATALGISTKKLSELHFKCHLRLPDPVHKQRSTLYYDKKHVDEFIASNPLNNLRSTAVTIGDMPTLDLDMALKFITSPSINLKPRTFADLVQKHLKKNPSYGKTVVVHLQELNNYERPHPQFSR